MAKIQLVVAASITLSVLLPGQAQNCFSKEHGCDRGEIRRVVNSRLILDPMPSPSPSSEGCQTSSEGPQSKRSVSPWNYVKDFNDTRYPHTLWQASCSCTNCISLTHSEDGDSKKIYTRMEWNGNSVPVEHTIHVFYRKPCPTDPNRFYLEPGRYSVNVACVCVAAQHS